MSSIIKRKVDQKSNGYQFCVVCGQTHMKSLMFARYTASVVHVLLTEYDFPLWDNVGAQPETVYWE